MLAFVNIMTTFFSTKKYECYIDLKSGAESGWDFSSRWIFDRNGQPSGNLTQINTRRNIPVDLNSFLYKAFVNMYKFYLILQKTDEAKFWLDKAYRWKEAINSVLYNEEDGIWYDFDEKLGKHRRYFYPSNLMPLWGGAMDENILEERGSRAVEYMKKRGVVGYRGDKIDTLSSLEASQNETIRESVKDMTCLRSENKDLKSRIPSIETKISLAMQPEEMQWEILERIKRQKMLSQWAYPKPLMIRWKQRDSLIIPDAEKSVVNTWRLGKHRTDENPAH
ncbi:hypothetical protein JTB14_028106 [Gonioctena quinquepunctata]|nr:hypothetical protein JTB14_028106 [Gonioctena quinquepunctata]